MKALRGLFHADLLSASVLALLGLYLVWESAGLPLGTLRSPGAGLFPALLSLLLVLLSIVHVIVAFRSKGKKSLLFGLGLNRVLAALLIMALYGALLDEIGFPILTPLLLLAMLRGLGRVSWPRSLLIAITATAAVFVLFRVLGVPLPGGLTGF